MTPPLPSVRVHGASPPLTHLPFASSAACDCDPEGSQSSQCKEDGRCECRAGFVGARCDMCEENYFYNRSVPGCQQCPSCYSLVRDKVRTANWENLEK